MIARNDPYLRDWFSDFYQPRRLILCSPSTLHKYDVTFNHYERWLGRKARVSDLEEGKISSHLIDFAVGRAPYTIAKQRSQLLALAGLAYKKGFLDEAPEVMPIRTPHRKPNALPLENMRRLLVAARDVPGEISGIPAAIYWPCVFLIGYDTSHRAGGIFGIRMNDLRMEQSAIWFRWERNKSKKEGLYRVREETLTEIKRMLSPQREMLFPEPWKCEGTRYNRMKSIFKIAGLPTGHSCYTQKIRRTSATEMHKRDGDATAQLQHSSDTVTRKWYLADDEDTVQAADLLEDILPRPTISSNDPQLRLF
jgi:integrase